MADGYGDQYQLAYGTPTTNRLPLAGSHVSHCGSIITMHDEYDTNGDDGPEANDRIHMFAEKLPPRCTVIEWEIAVVGPQNVASLVLTPQVLVDGIAGTWFDLNDTAGDGLAGSAPPKYYRRPSGTGTTAAKYPLEISVDTYPLFDGKVAILTTGQAAAIPDVWVCKFSLSYVVD